jgi:uncharacterized protein YgiM (DUF1202 family)
MAILLRPSHQHRFRQLGRSWQLRVLFGLSLIWLGPTLACGSFAPRPTPTPTTAVVIPDATSAGAPSEPTIGLAEVPTVEPTPTPTMIPLPTEGPTPIQPAGNVLAVGQPARVVAPAGLNMRQEPRSGSELILQLGTGIRVQILAGPESADGYTWWQVDDGQGNVGWVAERDADTEWLSPQMGQAQPVDRSPRVGDRVQVTTAQLTIRSVPGTGAASVSTAVSGQQFTVQAGPQAANGYNWYQIRSDDGQVEGWAAEGDGSTRWLSPIE